MCGDLFGRYGPGSTFKVSLPIPEKNSGMGDDAQRITAIRQGGRSGDFVRGGGRSDRTALVP